MGGGGAAAGGGGGGDKAEGQYGTAKTSVWWDIENCHVPRGSDPHAIAQNISSALAEMGYKGAVTVSAYGDTNKIPNAVQQALSSTGISLNHVPAGIKDASDKKNLVDMLFWAVDNPPPANYLLISGDRDFSNALHQLRMRRYNILLAQPPNVSQALVAAAKSVWLWTSLVAGGPPMQNSETSYLGNALSGNTACSEAGKNTTEDSVPFSGSSSMRNEDSYGFGRADNRYKGKQAWRNQAQSTADIPRTSSNEFRQSTMGSREGYGMQLPKQLSMPMMSISETQEGTQFNHKGVGSSPFSSPQKPQREPGFSHQSEGKQFNRAPHEFFWANKPRTSDGPFIEPPHPGCPINNGNNFPNNHQTQYPQPLRLSDVPPPQPSLAPGNHIASNSHNYSSYPPPLRSNAPPFRPGPPANLPDISRLKVSEYPSGVHQNSSFPQQNLERSGGIHNLQPFYHENMHRPQPNAMDSNISSNGTWGTPRCPMSSSVVQGLMGNILRALDELKVNKMTPTEANITDCIRYGEMGIQNFNVRMALDCAVENNAVVMHKLGANLPFYIGKNDRLWKCVNPLDSTVKHPEATWDAIQNFLSSTGGQSAISASECWYQAATILKKSCSDHLVLGDILQILNVTVHVKKWIIPNSYGWQPLTFTLKVVSESNVDVGER